MRVWDSLKKAVKGVPMAVPLIALGLGLYWCWRGGVYSFDSRFGWMTEGSNLQLSAPCIGGMVAGIVVALLGGRAMHPETERMSSWGLGLLCSIGSAAVGVANFAFGSTSPGSLVIQAVSFGLGIALAVRWGVVITGLGPRDACLALAGSLGVGGAGYLVLDMIPNGPTGVVMVSLLPLASGTLMACVLYRYAVRLRTPDVRRGARPAGMVSCVLVIAMLLVFLCVEEVLRISFTQAVGLSGNLAGLFTLATQVGSIVVSVVICAAVLVFKKLPSFNAMTRALLVLMVLGFLSLLLLGTESPAVGFALLGTGFWCLRLLLWITASTVARNADADPVRVFALIETAVCAGVVAAQFIGSPGSEEPTSRTAVVSVALLVVVFGVMVILDGKFIGALEGASLACDSNGIALQGDSELVACKDSNDKTAWALEEKVPEGMGAKVGCASWCSQEEAVIRLSNRCRLTPREREVLALLARGRSLPYIQEELCIAVGTAQAHVRHIYAKLEVHSRQELIDAVERARGENNK